MKNITKLIAIIPALIVSLLMSFFIIQKSYAEAHENKE